jgi:hypothetical protein
MSESYGIDCDELLEYHMEQTYRMLRSDGPSEVEEV